MKATLRKNGQMMIDLKLVQAVNLDMIKEAIISAQGYKDDNSFRPFKRFKTRKEILDVVRNHLIHYGCEIDYVVDDDLTNHFENKALENAKKLFPDLCPSGDIIHAKFNKKYS